MTIEVPPDQLYLMADRLRAAAAETVRATGSVPCAQVDGPLAGPVADFTAGARAATAALAGELDWLGDTIAAVADSWLALDGSRRPVPGQGVPE